MNRLQLCAFLVAPFAFLSVAAFAGCEVTLPSNDDSAATTTGTTTTTTGNSSSSSGSGEECSVSAADALILQVTPPPSAPPVDLSNCYLEGEPPPIEFDGTVRYLDGALNVDACPPNADCVASNYAIDIQGPAFAIESTNIPEGTFVHVLWNACRGGLIIHNLPSFGGETNPVATHESVWTVVMTKDHIDQVAEPDDYAGLAFEPVDSCMQGSTGHPNTSSKLDVAATDTGEHTTVAKGTKELTTFTGGPHAGTYAIANGGFGNVGMTFYVRSYAMYRQAP